MISRPGYDKTKLKFNDLGGGIVPLQRQITTDRREKCMECIQMATSNSWRQVQQGIHGQLVRNYCHLVALGPQTHTHRAKQGPVSALLHYWWLYSLYILSTCSDSIKASTVLRTWAKQQSIILLTTTFNLPFAPVWLHLMVYWCTMFWVNFWHFQE